MVVRLIIVETADAKKGIPAKTAIVDLIEKKVIADQPHPTMDECADLVRPYLETFLKEHPGAKKT
jgi:hypothetical protein